MMSIQQERWSEGGWRGAAWNGRFSIWRPGVSSRLLGLINYRERYPVSFLEQEPKHVQNLYTKRVTFQEQMGF